MGENDCLRGGAPNTAGIGSRVRVLGGPVRCSEREMMPRAVPVELRREPHVRDRHRAHVRIEVDWRDGRRSVIDSALPNREYEISAAPHVPRTTYHTPPTRHPFRRHLVTMGAHQHVEPYFDDFQRQPLLPNSFSQLGPGVAWRSRRRRARKIDRRSGTHRHDRGFP